jgi:thiamine-phosphate pyrophosphorylase
LQKAWATRFSRLVAEFRPAAIILRGVSPHAAALAQAARESDIAILIEDDVAEAASMQLDGVFLNGGAEGVGRARVALGTGALIGASCGLSRHEGMVAAEAGADYVAFAFDAGEASRVVELSSWWADVTEIPVALICDSGLPSPEAIHAGQPDFIQTCETEEAGESLESATKQGLASQQPV